MSVEGPDALLVVRRSWSTYLLIDFTYIFVAKSWMCGSTISALSCGCFRQWWYAVCFFLGLLSDRSTTPLCEYAELYASKLAVVPIALGTVPHHFC